MIMQYIQYYTPIAELYIKYVLNVYYGFMLYEFITNDKFNGNNLSNSTETQ